MSPAIASFRYEEILDQESMMQLDAWRVPILEVSAVSSCDHWIKIFLPTGCEYGLNVSDDSTDFDFGLDVRPQVMG